MRVLILVFVAFSASCATAHQQSEREAEVTAGIYQMGLGGGFFAVGVTAMAASVVPATFATDPQAKQGGELIFAASVVPMGVGGVLAYLGYEKVRSWLRLPEPLPPPAHSPPAASPQSPPPVAPTQPPASPQ